MSEELRPSQLRTKADLEKAWIAQGVEIAALRAEVERLRGADWQPIETAPQDGTRILAVDQVGWIAVCSYHSDCWLDSWLDCPDYDLTHWMPLPAPPSEALATGQTEG